MVKKYQETAQFVYGARDVTELRNLSLFMGEPQKFIVRQALVLSDTDYQNFINDDFRKPPVAIRVKQRYMGFDVKKKAWNCLLVVSEIGKEGILVGKEPDVERYYMAYVPEHSKLRLPADLPVEFWTNVCTTTLQLQPSAEVHSPLTEQENRRQHFASFVGMEISTVCFSLRFMSYDPQADQMVTRLYGGPHDYIENRGTPQEIARENHFSGKMREIFFNMDYRNISHTFQPETMQMPQQKTPGKSREKAR